MPTLPLSRILTLALLVLPTAAAAQTAAEVTVKVPVTLSQFGSDITKVRVACFILSDAIVADATSPGSKTARAEQEIQMSGGQVSATATLVFSLKALDNPIGKTAQLYCLLEGSSPSSGGYIGFDAQASNLSFRTSSGNTGTLTAPSFTW